MSWDGVSYPLPSKPVAVHTDGRDSFAWAQMYLGLAAMFRRYKMTLYDTERSRDVDHTWGGFVGEPATNSKGIRVLINKSDSQVGI